MTRVGNVEIVGIVNVRLDVVVDRSVLGERRQYVEGGEGARSSLDPGRFGRDRGDERREDLELALENPLIRAEHFFFIFLQRRGDEAFASGDCLFTRIV